MKRADTPGAVYRLARRPDPWAWPDWAYADVDGTFGNRFDDPRGIYRVLYASTQRIVAFVECLAYFRPDPEVMAELAEIVGDEDEEEPPSAGVVPSEWVGVRCVGTGVLVGDYVDVGHHETLGELRTALAPRVVHHGLHDLDAAAIRLSAACLHTGHLAVRLRPIRARNTHGWAYSATHGSVARAENRQARDGSPFSRTCNRPLVRRRSANIRVTSDADGVGDGFAARWRTWARR